MWSSIRFRITKTATHQSWKSDQRNFVNFVPQSFKSMLTVEEQRVAAIGVNFPSEDLTFAKIG